MIALLSFGGSMFTKLQLLTHGNPGAVFFSLFVVPFGLGHKQFSQVCLILSVKHRNKRKKFFFVAAGITISVDHHPDV